MPPLGPVVAMQDHKGCRNARRNGKLQVPSGRTDDNPPHLSLRVSPWLHPVRAHFNPLSASLFQVEELEIEAAEPFPGNQAYFIRLPDKIYQALCDGGCRVVPAGGSFMVMTSSGDAIGELKPAPTPTQSADRQHLDCFLRRSNESFVPSSTDVPEMTFKAAARVLAISTKKIKKRAILIDESTVVQEAVKPADAPGVGWSSVRALQSVHALKERFDKSQSEWARLASEVRTRALQDPGSLDARTLQSVFQDAGDFRQELIDCGRVARRLRQLEWPNKDRV